MLSNVMFGLYCDTGRLVFGGGATSCRPIFIEVRLDIRGRPWFGSSISAGLSRGEPKGDDAAGTTAEARRGD